MLVFMNLLVRILSRQPFQLRQEEHCVGARVAAHLVRGRQAGADARPTRLPENPATVIVVQLHAAHAGWLAVRHAGNRRADRRGNAAGAAAGAAAGGIGRGHGDDGGKPKSASISQRVSIPRRCGAVVDTIRDSTRLD